jgi:hypothetical protein
MRKFMSHYGYAFLISFSLGLIVIYLLDYFKVI